MNNKMKHYIQITYHGWWERRVYQLDASECKHEVTDSGHLIVRCAKGIVYAAAPGMWHEVQLINETKAMSVRAKMQDAFA